MPNPSTISTKIRVGPSAPLALEYRPVGSLLPDPRNARTHPKRQVEQIAASIREFGFANPILTDPEGRIIAGHGRLLAAKALGLSEVPVIALPDLYEAQKLALRLADNKIALGAGWDLDLLKVELGELSAMDVDLDDRHLPSRKRSPHPAAAGFFRCVRGLCGRG